MSDAGPRGDARPAPQGSDEVSNISPTQNVDKIIVGKFWRNRHRSEYVEVALFKSHDHPLCDARVFIDDDAGCSKPSKTGLCLSVGKLDELIATLRKARVRAAEIGWLKS